MRFPGIHIAAGIAAFTLLGATGASFALEIDDPLVAEGKVLFEETAGDIGCATCHGIDGTGDPDAGGVFIQGVTAAQMYSAMNGGVEEMSEIFDLSTHEISAIHAYLDYLFLASRATGGPEAVEFPGKEIFQETAGGVGCASCHREDAGGDVGPNIQGRTFEDIRAALDGGVEDMGFIELTDEEVRQVAEYLHFLYENAGK